MDASRPCVIQRHAVSLSRSASIPRSTDEPARPDSRPPPSPTRWSAAHRRRARAPRPAARGTGRFRGGRCLRLAAAGRPPRAGSEGQPGRDGAAAGHRPGPRHAAENTSASPEACRPTTPCSGAPAAWASRRWSRPSTREINRDAAGRAAAQAGRDPSRGHREPARPDGPAARRRRTASSCSATICPSTATIPPTSR